MGEAHTFSFRNDAEISLLTGSGFRTARMHMHIVLRESDAGVNLFYLSFCFERTTV